MSDLTAKFTTFEEQIATEHTAVMSSLSDIADTLSLLNTALDTLNNNGATNTKALLAALGQTGACFPCPTPSITVPPIDTTVNPIDADRCKRSQALIATIHNILSAMDTLQSFNVVGTFSIINDAIGQVIAAIAAGDTVPLPSFPEAVGIVGNYVSYAGERLFSGVSLIEQFSTLESALTNAVFAGSTAEASKAAYDAVIDGSSASNVAKFLFKAVPYSALVSYYLDPATSPDLSGFEGTTCGFSGCLTEDAALVALGDRGGSVPEAYTLAPPPGFDSDTTIQFGAFAPYVFAEPIIWVGDAFGWTINYVSGEEFHIDAVDGSNANVYHFIANSVSGIATITAHTVKVMVATNTNAGGATNPFSAEVCSPEV